MITTPSVFVLGAGASAPYGFPLGSALVDGVCEKLHKKSSTLFALVRDACHDNESPDRVIDAFAKDLANAGRSSIDAFLQMRPEYLPVGKACIAAALLPCENENELDLFSVGDPEYLTPEAVLQRRVRRWYHYLFDQMLTGGSFADNRLSIITFNFDRSFERALYRVLRAQHAGNEDEIRRLCSTVPIIHVHGSLGAPAWLTDSAGGRQYESDNLSGDVVRACADQIQLVFDGAEGETLKRAHTMLNEATNVCFLGFSYHPLNLEKLDHLELGRVGKTTPWGTAFKMPDGPKRAVQRRFDGKINLMDWDILTFLQQTDFIHE